MKKIIALTIALTMVLSMTISSTPVFSAGESSVTIAYGFSEAAAGDSVSIFVMQSGKKFSDLLSAAGGDVRFTVARCDITTELAEITSDGESIANLNGKSKLDIKMNVSNRLEDTASYVMLIGVFDSQDRLKAARFFDDSVSASGDEKTYSVELESACSSGDYIRCFVLEGFGTLNPLANVLDIFR